MNFPNFIGQRSAILIAATVLATITAIAFGVRPPSPDRSSSALPEGAPQQEPAWRLKNTAGQEIRSTDSTGEIKIIAFWATWCPPCRAEIPGFIQLQKDYKDRGLQIIGISMDDDSAANIASFAAKSGINYPVLLGSPDVIKAFGGVEVLPTTFLVDRDGRVAKRHLGYVAPEVLRNEVQELLGR